MADIIRGKMQGIGNVAVRNSKPLRQRSRTAVPRRRSRKR